MNAPNRRTRVFISCGQAIESSELETARIIANLLQDLGFSPYLALQEQSLRGVKENIFARLEQSEYFLFIDFKREELPGANREHRGSLFSHQELAIASYLNLPMLAFQEAGVRRTDGLLGFLQGNSKTFTDRGALPQLVREDVTESWTADWRNELVMSRDETQYLDAVQSTLGVESKPKHTTREVLTTTVMPAPAPRSQPKSRYFHIDVRNRHRRTPATNCYVYLEGVRDLRTDQALPIRTIELKWAGYTFPNAIIGPHASRAFDAFWVSHANPRQPNFPVLSDSGHFVPRLVNSDRYLLTYTVLSAEFAPVTCSFEASFGRSIDDVKLTEADS